MRLFEYLGGGPFQDYQIGVSVLDMKYIRNMICEEFVFLPIATE